MAYDNASISKICDKLDLDALSAFDVWINHTDIPSESKLIVRFRIRDLIADATSNAPVSIDNICAAVIARANERSLQENYNIWNSKK